MSAGKRLRDESTEEGRRIWADVDLAASRAPEWIVVCLLARGHAEPSSIGMVDDSRKATP